MIHHVVVAYKSYCMQHIEVSEGSMPVLKLVIYQFSVTVDNFKAGEWCGGRLGKS